MLKVAVLICIMAFVVDRCRAANACTSDGKFIADFKCTSYVVCIQNGPDFVSYTIPCPTGFFVRYQDMVCSKSTDCDSSFSCQSLGDFPSATNASTYISCVQGLGDTIIALSKECPAPMEFNVVSGVCEEIITPFTIKSELTTVSSTSAEPSGRAEIMTGIPPTFTTTTEKMVAKMPNSSRRNYSSISIVLAVIFYNLFANRLDV